jgi:hypothetical protein
MSAVSGLLMFRMLIGFLAALCLAGCSGGLVEHTGAAVPPADTGSRQLPFAQDARTVAIEGSLPAGTPIAIRLRSSISSATASAGDRFNAVLDDNLQVDGKTLAAKGTQIMGRVVAARRSGHLHAPGYLRITLATISLNGKHIPLQTSSIFVQSRSHRQRNLAMIGGGAGAGALFGGLAADGKGALIGTALGAAGGTATAYATGKKEVRLGVERRLTFRLVQPLVMKG